MKIQELIAGLPIELARGDCAQVVADVVEDSRLVTPGCLFIARAGAKADGRKFIADAIARGAVAILTDDKNLQIESTAMLLCSDINLATALAAERFHGSPSSKLKLIGVTGTNGKTTITYLIRQMLSAAGIKCGLIGTVEIDDGASATPANLTTPPAVELSRLMRRMVDNGCRACVMEASSHALHQKRTAGLSFHAGLFTNLTGDHLDYHQTMENYLDAKAILFEGLPASGFAILNADDECCNSLSKRTKAKVIHCSVTDPSADWLARIGRQTLNATEVMFLTKGMEQKSRQFDCRVPLIGRHNVINALQAMAVCSAMGVSQRQLVEAIAKCKAPPGRLEPVTGPDDPFAVLVDYAHTDDALENVLRALRPIVSSSPNAGQLRVVFGCGGDRDRTKRPRMARIACKYADDVIITSDNPRTEDPQAIINEIHTGVPSEKLEQATCIVDREQAIETAIDRTRDGDIVLIAGKGHEDYQIIGTTRRPFDDRKIAAAALANRVSGAAAA
jgi:UDP-N-acetylmuramoyl-L-alanyl-D-glutamate--2,6-diaminopimelate ligase